MPPVTFEAASASPLGTDGDLRLPHLQGRCAHSCPVNCRPVPRPPLTLLFYLYI